MEMTLNSSALVKKWGMGGADICDQPFHHCEGSRLQEAGGTFTEELHNNVIEYVCRMRGSGVRGSVEIIIVATVLHWFGIRTWHLRNFFC